MAREPNFLRHNLGYRQIPLWYHHSFQRLLTDGREFVVNMEAGSRIVVEEGATLIISESEITTSKPPQGIVGFGHGIGSSASSFMIPASD